MHPARFLREPLPPSPNQSPNPLYTQPIHLRRIWRDFRRQTKITRARRPRIPRGRFTERVAIRPLVIPRGAADMALEGDAGAGVSGAPPGEATVLPDEGDVQVGEIGEVDEARVEDEAAGFDAAFTGGEVGAAGDPGDDVADVVGGGPAGAAEHDVDLEGWVEKG
ncbi:MAG: hypothetical protein L6R40_006951 [Gallowayella cf. fulva]|nr:MAG: hypothetical protein L6R40_006951 [Xanthomendoza cf. fulva]